METLDNIGINVCVGWFARTLVVSIFRYSFVCLRCAVCVNILQIVFSQEFVRKYCKWETCKIFKVDRLLVRV